MKTYPLFSDSNFLIHSLKGHLPVSLSKLNLILEYNQLPDDLPYDKQNLSTFFEEIIQNNASKDITYKEFIEYYYLNKVLDNNTKFDNLKIIVNNIFTEIIYNYFVNDFVDFLVIFNENYKNICNLYDELQYSTDIEKRSLIKLANTIHDYFNLIFKLFKNELAEKKRNQLMTIPLNRILEEFNSINFQFEDLADITFAFLFIDRDDYKQFYNEIFLKRDKYNKFKNQVEKTQFLKEPERLRKIQIELCEYSKTKGFDPLFVVSKSDIHNPFSKEEKQREIKKIFHHKLSKIALSSTLDQFLEFIDNPSKGLLFDGKSAEFSKYKVGYILWSLSKIYNQRIKTESLIFINYKKRFDTFGYEDFYNSYRQYGVGFSKNNKPLMDSQFKEIYDFIENFQK